MLSLRNRCHGVRQLLLHYSTSSAAAAQLSQTHYMVDYLISSLGFSTQEAVSTSTKVSHLKSTKTPDSVINFLTQLGLDKTHIKAMIFLVPRLLLSNPEKNLRPKFGVLQDLGLSGMDLVKVISTNRTIVCRGLDTQILPSIKYLKELLGSDKKVATALTKAHWMLSRNAVKRIQANVLLLQKYSFSKENIQRFIVTKPRYVLLDPKWLEVVLRRVEGELGIPRDSGMFLHGVHALASVSKSTIEMKFDIFRSFGWSDSDITTMVRNLPFCLTIHETKIRKGLNFFMKELGYTPSYLASHPKLLLLSLEKRVIPRNEILKMLQAKKLLKRRIGLYSAVCYSELKFVEEFVLRYKDKVPDIHGTYISYMKQ